MDLGPHAAIIWLCYAAIAVVMVLVGLWLVVDGQRLSRELAALERRGVRRRSAKIEVAGTPEPNTRD
ncbi:MAG: heme exporter protein CcmD [Hyphomicrobiaceae bacterium]